MKRASIGIALLVSGFLAGLVLTGRLRSAEESTAQTAQRPSQAVAIPAAVAASGTLPDLTGDCGASRQRRRQHLVRAGGSTAELSVRQRSVLRIFLRRPARTSSASRNQLARSLGSGVLISDDGYVVTNSHVIGSEKADVTVVFADKHEAPARIIGIDKATDLALVKVAKPGQPPLKWGDSSQAKVAEWVLAIGSPYQLSHSVSLGIISALGRKNLGFSEYEDFIQTDAAINQGNSGGALVNARGELIGINTGIFSSDQNGGIRRHRLRDSQQSRTPRHRRAHRARRRPARLAGPDDAVSAHDAGRRRSSAFATTTGAFVNQIDRRSPAYQAGLEPGDIIMSFNGQKVTDPNHLVQLTSDAPIGSTAVVVISAKGASHSQDSHPPARKLIGSRLHVLPASLAIDAEAQSRIDSIRRPWTRPTKSITRAEGTDAVRRGNRAEFLNFLCVFASLRRNSDTAATSSWHVLPTQTHVPVGVTAPVALGARL